MPLTVMHAAAGVTLKQPHRDEVEYREAVGMLDEQARRLSRIVDDMFVLARADAGRYPLRRAALYLDGLVRLGLAREAGRYRLTVSDTGPGIPAEARPHVFERFYRADKARSRSEDGGAGLGLAIARWVARAHDGELELLNSDASGTTFVARLPAAARK